MIAGSFTVWASVLAENKSAGNQRQRDREAEREAIKGVLQAIETELKDFHEDFLGKLEKEFQKRDAQGQSQEPLKSPVVNQKYYTVYDSNAALLGRISGVFSGA